MIENIKIQGIATYGQSPQELARLSEINFIYGSNGTGKTTISRVIAGDASHTQSQVTWKGGLPLKTLVYNRDFVEKNFDQPAEIKGIFTLGEEDQNTFAEISVEKGKLDSINAAMTRLKFELEGDDGNGGKTASLKELEIQFEAKCWEVKRKHEGRFKDAFAGCLNSKKAFKKGSFRNQTITLVPLCRSRNWKKKPELFSAILPRMSNFFPFLTGQISLPMKRIQFCIRK